MKKTTFILIFQGFFLLTFCQYTWLALDSFPGNSGGGIKLSAAFSVNGNGYIVGGYRNAARTQSSNEVWDYSPTSNSWTSKSTFPGGSVANPASLTIGNSAYVIGGDPGGGGSYYSANYQYNPSADTWTQVAAYPENGITGAFHFTINGIGYVGAGGTNASQPSATAYSYNPGTDTWTSIANYPGSLSVDLVSFAIDSFGYAGMGFDGSDPPYSTIYQYNPSQNAWSPIAPFPGFARVGAVAFVINGKAYVGGGWTFGSGGCIFELSDFYEYDPLANSWAPVAGLIGLPREGSESFSIASAGYIVGGSDDINDNLVSFVGKFGACSDLATALPPSPTPYSIDVQLYPNPASQQINVKIGAEVVGQIQYKIVSIDGKTVFSGSTEQNNFILNTNNLEEAVYLLQIIGGDGAQTIKRFEVIH